MKRRLIKAIKSESGQALPIVLILLVLGGLLIAPCLSYAATGLNAGRAIEENVNGLYAADAGIEHALWSIKNDAVPAQQPYPLPEENINQMQVAIQTDSIGTYTLYFGDIIVVDERSQGQEHWKWLTVEGEMVLVDEELQAYKYTITVTRQPEAEGNIYLTEVGVRLPVGYSYQSGSAAGMSPLDPDPIEQDAAGAYMISWKFDNNPNTPPYTPEPELLHDDPESWVATQTFYVTDVTGEGELEGDYTWVVAKRNDIGTVGEVIGELYRITATATNPEDSEITAIVMADAMWNETEGEIRIILWQINPQ